MSDIAKAALERGPHAPDVKGMDRQALDLSDGPAVADVWTDGDLGFVLLLHRRSDGFVASELYYSTKDSNLRWTDTEHLSGGITGFDPTQAPTSGQVLSNAILAVVSDSESRLSTGRSGYEDDGELIRVYELLVSGTVGHLRIERIEKQQYTPGTAPTRTAHTSFEKGLSSPVAIAVVRPGEILRVVPVERNTSPTNATGEGFDLFPAVQ
ncbi:hypothetical protein ACFYPC_02720 [Streptomyces sp. NPDC005808]|uniref:hypothetical protein n=1 Tax=Streptomyces sp. NPDC005808 TaxID=3364734 RepID=UPI0036BF37AE